MSDEKADELISAIESGFDRINQTLELGLNNLSHSVPDMSELSQNLYGLSVEIYNLSPEISFLKNSVRELVTATKNKNSK